MKWQPPPNHDGTPCRKCTQTVPCTPEHEATMVNVMGPKSKFTPDSANRFLEAIQKGGSNRMACAAAGWSEEVWMKWRVEVKKNEAPPCIVDFVLYDVPNARRVLYEKALAAVEDGLSSGDKYEAAQVGFKILEKLYGRELEPVVTPLSHEGPSGGPVEFKVIFDDPTAPLPGKPREENSDDAVIP